MAFTRGVFSTGKDQILKQAQTFSKTKTRKQTLCLEYLNVDRKSYIVGHSSSGCLYATSETNSKYKIELSPMCKKLSKNYKLCHH